MEDGDENMGEKFLKEKNNSHFFDSWTYLIFLKMHARVGVNEG